MKILNPLRLMILYSLMPHSVNAGDLVIKALLPRDNGHQFAVYGDSCSGVPGTAQERNFARVNALFPQLSPRPEFIAFVGDHIAGNADYEICKSQWKYFWDIEMAWNKADPITIYNTPGNHDTRNPQNERAWREVFSKIPDNGPQGQKGLAYYIRRKDLLLVFADTSASVAGGSSHVESRWLDQVLQENVDAKYKFVLAHYPVFPVNGYSLYSYSLEHSVRWHLDPKEGAEFWNVLKKHSVDAYLCSHIIAYDVQIHDGIPQICTAGAGTQVGMGAFMPDLTEYFHILQLAIDQRGICVQTIDIDGKTREWLTWPLPDPLQSYHDFDPATAYDEMNRLLKAEHGNESDKALFVWRISGRAPAAWDPIQQQTLLLGWDYKIALNSIPSLWIGTEGAPPRLTVRLLTDRGLDMQSWRGPLMVDAGKSFNYEVAIHTGMGPGGIMWRKDAASPWSSFQADTARGTENFTAIPNWSVGKGAQNEHQFKGTDLKIAWMGTKLDAPFETSIAR